eukprot:TRINITY_DN10990_c0_g1_i1.p1 TRINITY_DN10990_c0_g1~~TRINITY_DN10990_c0_g1_i1.p1  ORF type:complete len:127 (+),score=25.48 TRINITY_DN10990_c0_g1_i1:54-383(+)
MSTKQTGKKRKKDQVDEENLDWLPPGWQTYCVERLRGRTKGKMDRYWVSPEKLVFRSKISIKTYLRTGKVPKDVKLNSSVASQVRKKRKVRKAVKVAEENSLDQAPCRI